MKIQQRVFSKAAILLLLIASLIPSAKAGDILKFGGPQTSSPLVSFDNIDHSDFNTLLRHYVDDRGRVCYRKWAGHCCDTRRLQTYLFHLSQVNPSPPASQKSILAYYINAYNALTLWGILDSYPVVSIQKLDGEDSRYAIFDDLRLWVGDRHLSLNQIENDALRPMGDARIHFALVCAARGCPRLRNEAYFGPRVDRQLTDNSIEFFSDRSRFHISQVTGKVKISPILKWYREDFGSTDYAVVSAVFPYLPKEDRCWLAASPGWKLSYLGYDWGLNDGCPTLPIALGKLPYRAYSKISPFIAPLIPPKPEDVSTSNSEPTLNQFNNDQALYSPPPNIEVIPDQDLE